MNQIITLAFAGFTFLTSAQTPLISHKSHSGTSIAFFIDPSSNFGAVRMEFDQPRESARLHSAERFIPLNDSTIIREVTDHNQQVIKTDTLPNKNRYSDVIFQYKYEDSIRKEEQMRIHQEELKREEALKKRLELQQQQINEPETSKKKTKKSYLLFLFGITGGGMLLMRLFSQSKSNQSIA